MPTNIKEQSMEVPLMIVPFEAVSLDYLLPEGARFKCAWNLMLKCLERVAP